MSSYSDTCLDASVILRTVGNPGSELTALWRQWTAAGMTLHAPALVGSEIVNGVHRLRRAGMLSEAAAKGILARALRMPLVLHDDEHLHLRALELATDHKLPATYDSHYLALAERLGIEFWTADTKLAKAVRDRLPWVRLVS
jgi:predicted nucleic acid-binding protein